SVHLSVTYCNFSIGNKTLNHSGYFFDVFNSVMDEKYLTATLNFISNSITNHFFTKRNQMCFNRVTIWWRSRNYRQIASCHKRKLQSSRNGCGCQSKSINILSNRFEFIFYVYSKFLFFINNQKS